MTENNQTVEEAKLRNTLGLGDISPARRWLKRLLAVAVVVALGGGLLAWVLHAGAEDLPDYVKQPIDQGDLLVTVTATGSLHARETVDVGAEVSGRILKVHADFNDPVRKGQVLAELDTEQLGARLQEAKARVRSARASERSARATAKEARLAERRATGLAERGLISQAALEATLAGAARSRADASAAAAQTAIARATLLNAQNKMGRATIASPIDGVVLARNVEAGQTLASNFQVPVLFRIAKDLSQMELSVSIDEADVGRTKEGQRATFTVDAYPDRTFESTVRALRNVPTIEQNVVTYEAVLTVDNSQRLLRPGMTATATIVTETIVNVTLVPNSALRFTPPDVLDKLRKDKEDKPRKAQQLGADKPRHKVWFLDGTQTKSIDIDIGATDGRYSQLTGGELPPGLQVLVDLRIDEGKP